MSAADDRRWCRAVGLCAVLLFALTASGKPTSWDGTVMMDVAYRLWYLGRWDIAITPQELPAALRTKYVPWGVGMRGPDGRQYSAYGPGFSLAAVPLVAVADGLARLSGADPPLFVVYFVNAITTGASCGAVAALALALGLSRRRALLAAAAFGFATFAWVYAKFDFSEPLCTLCLVCAVHRLVRYDAEGHAFHLVLAGLWSGAALLTRVAAVIALPVLLAMVQATVAQRRSGGFVAASAALGAGLVPAAVGLALYNALRTGMVLSTGYTGGGVYFFGNPLSVGVPGLLWSLHQGIAVYAPLSLLWPLAVVRMARCDPGRVRVFLALPIVFLLFHAKLIGWHGGPTWGPRYLHSVLPFLAIPVAGYVGSRAALAAALLAGAAVNLSAVLVFWERQLAPWVWRGEALHPFVPDFWFLTNDVVPPAARALAVALLALGAVGAGWWVWRGLGRRATSSAPPA